MSSGALPYACYHRASQLGAGTYGSVVCVYNDDGEEYALKLFLDDDDDEESIHSEEEYHPQSPLSLGALREISCLRLLRGENAHRNIANLVDVQPHFDEAEGAGTSDCLGAALPLYKEGSLQQAIEKGYFRHSPRCVKVKIAHGLLSAVAYMHDNNILHRDIKPDNVMLEAEEDGSWTPVLIDFSLAKKLYSDYEDKDHAVHTGEVGTPTYTAPEIVDREPYGKPSDIWSVGVVLLELLRDEIFTATKDRHAAEAITESLNQLPQDQPFPSLLRGLLEKDASQRLTARQALDHTLFAKFHLEPPPVRLVDVADALPLEEHDDHENESPNRQKLKCRQRERRAKLVHQVCRELDCKHPMTPIAALEYVSAMSQLDDAIDDLSQTQTLLHCVVLAYRFFELELLDLDGLDDEEVGLFKNWSLEDYVDDEATIFMLLDFCLYPRGSRFGTAP